MANSGSSRYPTSKNIIYDSGNDTSTGRKRAVELGAGVSVAERARLFGTQITHSSGNKNVKSQLPLKNNSKVQWPPKNNAKREPSPISNQPSPVNNQPPISNIVHQQRNYQPYRQDITRNPKYDTAYIPPQVVPNYSRPPFGQSNDKKQNREQPRNYSTVTRSQNRQQQSPPYQPPVSTYDTFQHSTSEKKIPTKTNPIQITPGESYKSEQNPYSDSYERQKLGSPLRNLNYFQPIQDPLEAFYKESSQTFYQQQQIPPPINTNTVGMQAFEIGNLISRIQEDYLNNVRPYVSSVEFIESEQSLANIGFATPLSSRKNYTRRDDIGLQQGATYYDVIDPSSSLYPAYSRQVYNDSNSYSSMRRRKQRRRYHDQASSPIHFPQSSGKKNQQYEPESPPTTPKASTPVVESEEEDTVATTTQADASKTTEPESSSESEEESSEHPIPTPAAQPNKATLPTLPNQPTPTVVRTPAKLSETESSGTEESNSDSESESDDEKVVKPKPSPATQSNNLRPTAATPQANTRGTPQTNARGTPQTNARDAPQINARGLPQTNARGPPQTNARGPPQTNARDVPQRTTINNTTVNHPPEYSSSANTFDLQDSKKSPGGRFKSITNKFRRKK